MKVNYRFCMKCDECSHVLKTFKILGDILTVCVLGNYVYAKEEGVIMGLWSLEDQNIHTFNHPMPDII